MKVYLAFAEEISDYDPLSLQLFRPNERFEQPPSGKLLGEYSTRGLAFSAMTQYAASLAENMPPSFGGWRYTFTKQRSDGLYVAYFDHGEDSRDLGSSKKNCIEFIIVSSGGDL